VTFCIVLIWGVSVFHWNGDLANGEEFIERLICHADRQSLAPYLAVGLGLKGELLVKRGEIDEGMRLLRSSLEALQTDRYALYTTGFNITLAEGLAVTGRLDRALATIEETIGLVTCNGDLVHLPELLRIRGELLERSSDERGAEECFLRSVELAGQQSGLSWQLRAATNLARLKFRQGRREEAREVLAETYGRFNEGFGTADLKAAKLLLDEIGEPAAVNSGPVFRNRRRLP